MFLKLGYVRWEVTGFLGSASIGETEVLACCIGSIFFKPGRLPLCVKGLGVHIQRHSYDTFVPSALTDTYCTQGSTECSCSHVFIRELSSLVVDYLLIMYGLQTGQIVAL